SEERSPVPDPALPPDAPLKRSPGLRAALAAAVLVYALLFVLTTFPHSPEAQAQAAAYFTPQEIEPGLRFAHQRRLFFWCPTAPSAPGCRITPRPWPSWQSSGRSWS